MAVQNRRYINKMRQDAIRRSHETNDPMSGCIGSDIPPERQEAEISGYEDEIGHHQPPKQPQKNSVGALLGELVGGSIDSDKLLIAAILLMLMKEGGDKRLILALGYILM